MKKGILYSSLAGFGLVLLSLAVYTNQGAKEYYTPREVTASKDGYKGAAEWLHRMRANPQTGEIDPKDVENARIQARQFASKKSTSALGLTWENMGPNDIGGRIRAFLIDKDNPDIMFAGGVSGGLFKTINAGASWAPINDLQENLAVVSIAQAANGDIYYGTGEGMYYFANGVGTGGIAGDGMFKSTDGGNTFSVLPSTTTWASIGKIVCDPNNPNLVYAATNSGVQVSEDGGVTWANPANTFGAATLDMTIDSQGRVWAKIGDRFYKSDGTVGGFTEISKSQVGIQPNELPRTSGRSRIAVSPQDPNYVYVITTASNNFDKAYRSTDGGANWTVIGEQNFYLNPHGAQGNGQGTYDNAVTVDATNKDRIMVGGVTLWEWTLSGGWELAASIGGSGGGFPYYVHADMHHVVWHPTKPNFVFALNDGGVFRSKNNGETWDPISKGFVTTQFYSIAVGANGEIMGGTQDNGTIFIDPANYYSESGVRTPGVNFNGSVRDGDGGYADMSKLNEDVMFKEMQYGVMGRSTDGGDSYESIYDFDRMDPNGVAGNGSNAFADFIMPFTLWEKLNDPTSTDSVIFSADSLVNDFGSGGGDSVFEGSFVAPRFEKTTVNGEVVNTTATLDSLGFTLDAGSRRITVDANGELVASGVNSSLKGGSFINYFIDASNNNLPTVEFKVSFDSIVKNDNVVARLPISYNAGDKIIVKSRTNDIDLIYSLPSAANSVTNPEILFQDAVQSAFFVGLRTNTLNTPTGNPNDAGGIWMTRDVLTNLVSTPEWYHIGTLAQSELPQCMAVSGDGDVLYVGTSSGRVYRFSNLSNARDSASADIDDFYRTDSTRASTSVVQKTMIRNFGGGRAVTSIATHPFDKDKLVVTLGNYGSTDHVYYSGNATAAAPVLIQKDLSGLPDFPVYASTFNFNDPTGKQVVIGTEMGVYTTDDISAASVTWTAENTGLANVPVFDLIQQQTIRYDLYPTFKEGFYEGAIYAGTHGRGIFRTGSTQDYIGIKEVKPSEVAEATKMLNVYPNPATDKIFIDLALESRADVTVTIRNISGQLMKNVTYNKLSKDVDNIEVGVSNLAKGTYVITLSKGSEVISGKFIKQ
ncbi:BNR/Asp-box repeat protein [Owenweeksia hongkongensis DSM 17368]|uniref:BNR/Asp-box repeat protein n=1 Tax=Owenweeksia hongkongensis (strain DSM 17368 / CIP 108786 / JCM 12287 / NRRL B-23963 / UST20020801) TaxID=926562 RepID=G8R3Z9_OWEHD|nr:T9SS type A sorting domain-containing protein [Owenweeksia hongkongensis]AEV32031.1 BNR/Asp-box repeat protein [Owenweeksia hongkongensis DSM 17368]